MSLYFSQGVATYRGVSHPISEIRTPPPCADCSHPENHHTTSGCVTYNDDQESGPGCLCRITRAQLVAVANTIRNRNTP